MTASPKIMKLSFVQDIRISIEQIIRQTTPFAKTERDISPPNSGQQGFRMG